MCIRLFGHTTGTDILLLLSPSWLILMVQIKTPKVPNKISRPIRRERHDIKSASGPISSLGNDVKGLRFGCVYYIGVILIGSATVGYLGLWTNNLCFWSEQELFQLIVTPYNDFRKTYQFAA